MSVKHEVAKLVFGICGKNFDTWLLRKKGAIIGENFYGENSYFDNGFAYLLEIGNNVTITHATVLTHDASTKIPTGKTKIGKVVIGDNVFIGYGAIVLPNVKIGNNVVIGAGSIVTHDIPDNCIAKGAPCEITGNYKDFVNKNKEYIKNKPVFIKNKILSKEDIKCALESTFGYID